MVMPVLLRVSDEVAMNKTVWIDEHKFFEVAGVTRDAIFKHSELPAPRGWETLSGWIDAETHLCCTWATGKIFENRSPLTIQGGKVAVEARPNTTDIDIWVNGEQIFSHLSTEEVLDLFGEDIPLVVLVPSDGQNYGWMDRDRPW